MNDKHRPSRRDDPDSVEPPPTTRRAPFDTSQFARESDARFRTASEAPASGMPTVRPARSLEGSIPDVQEVEAKVGAGDVLGGDAIAVLVVSREEVDWFKLSHEATKLLAFVDGVRSLEAICAMASVRVEDGAVALLDLAEQGIVRFR
jgi:hypothetical protein